MDNNRRKIPLCRLVALGSLLDHFESFSEPVARCNFSIRAGLAGWGGKVYVDKHDVEEYQPDTRGVVVVNLYYIREEDYVILTPEQYKDYLLVAGSSLD